MAVGSLPFDEGVEAGGGALPISGEYCLHLFQRLIQSRLLC